MGLIFIIGVIFLVWVLFDHGHHHGHHGYCHNYGCHGDHDHSWGGENASGLSAREILDGRYARGEIDRQEYLDRRKDIET